MGRPWNLFFRSKSPGRRPSLDHTKGTPPYRAEWEGVYRKLTKAVSVVSTSQWSTLSLPLPAGRGLPSPIPSGKSDSCSWLDNSSKSIDWFLAIFSEGSCQPEQRQVLRHPRRHGNCSASGHVHPNHLGGGNPLEVYPFRRSTLLEHHSITP